MYKMKSQERYARYRWSDHRRNRDKEKISKTGVRRPKIHNHTIGGVDKKKELIFIFFSMCLPAILLFASIGVASATNYMPQDCYSFTIESAPDIPVSDPNGPYTGTEGVPIAYDGSDSYDTDGFIVAYEWALGDGSTSSEVNPTHIYAQNGTYSVSLTVTDNDGATNTSTTTATIADTGPTAAFSATPTSGQEPLTVTFTDNSISYDGIEAWSWDFDSDGETDSTEQNPIHEYREDGVYTMSLTVTESDGDSDTMTKTDYITVIKINNAPYTPAEPSPSDGATDVPIDADLSWTGGDPDAEDTETYDVHFGTNSNPPLAAENQPETTYDPGMLDYSTEYYWQIVATDDHGAMTEGGVWTFTTAAPDNTPPIVSNPSATPDTILNDNGRPRILGTNISQLSVTVTDDTEIDTVTIDLSPIGVSYEAQMTNIPGTDTWTITTNAVDGINIAHDLIVTATDTNGNSDSSVSIQLTILRRGDVDHDNDVDQADALAIKKYIKELAPDPGVFIGDVYPATGDNVVDEMDALYIKKYVSGKADEP
jgi:PKD repeat protein